MTSYFALTILGMPRWHRWFKNIITNWFSIELLVINFHTYTLCTQCLTLNGWYACVKHVYMTHLVQLCTALYRHCTCTIQCLTSHWMDGMHIRKHVCRSHAVNMIHWGIRQLDYCDNSTRTTRTTRQFDPCDKWNSCDNSTWTILYQCLEVDHRFPLKKDWLLGLL